MSIVESADAPKIRGPHDPYAALRLRAFRQYAAGLILSVVGQQLQSVAVGWEVFQRTHKAISLGWVGLVQAIPVLVLALPAGQLADWAERKTVVVLCQLFYALCSLALAWVSYTHGSIGTMYVILAAGATCTALSWPARQALLPQIVPTAVFANAVSWNSSYFQICAAVGPALGGFLILWHTWPAFVLDAICAVACAALTIMIQVERPAEKRQTPNLHSVAEGVRFVWRTKIILATLSLDLFAVLLGGATYLLPAFSTEILHVGSSKFGCLRAAPAIGAVCMAMVVAHRPPMKKAGRAMLLAVVGFGVATIIFGLSKNYWLSLAMLFLTGAFDNISVIIRHTLVQVMTPDPMRGRVSAVNGIFIGSSNELGGLESGVTAQIFGLVNSVVFGGIGTLLVVAATAIIWPQVARFGSLVDAKAEGES
jgi:MFS family permease